MLRASSTRQQPIINVVPEEAHYRQPNFKTPKILVPNLWIGSAIVLETPVSNEFLGSKPEFRAHFHSQTGVWERAVMRCCFRLSLGNALLRVTSVIQLTNRAYDLEHGITSGSNASVFECDLLALAMINHRTPKRVAQKAPL